MNNVGYSIYIILDILIWFLLICAEDKPQRPLINLLIKRCLEETGGHPRSVAVVYQNIQSLLDNGLNGVRFEDVAHYKVPNDKATNQPNLNLTAKIPSEKLKSLNDNEKLCEGLCALPDDVVLFNRCTYSGVRAISLRTNESYEQGPKVEGIIWLWRMSYDALTDTLLIVELASRSANDSGYHLATLRREHEKWIRVESITTLMDTFPIQIDVCESRVLLAYSLSDKVSAFELSADHKLRPTGTITLDRVYFSVASTRIGGQTYVAFSHMNTVSLHRLLDDMQLEAVSEIGFLTAPRVLFRGNVLLVDGVDENDFHAIGSFVASAGGLSFDRMLINSDAGINVNKWCISGNRLVVWDGMTNDLLVYSLD